MHSGPKKREPLCELGALSCKELGLMVKESSQPPTIPPDCKWTKVTAPSPPEITKTLVIFDEYTKATVGKRSNHSDGTDGNPV